MACQLGGLVGKVQFWTRTDGAHYLARSYSLQILTIKTPEARLHDAGGFVFYRSR